MTSSLQLWRVLKDRREKENKMEKEEGGVVSLDASVGKKTKKADTKSLVEKAVEIMMKVEKVREINDDNARTGQELAYLRELKRKVSSASSIKTIDAILEKACQRWVLIGGKVGGRLNQLVKHNDVFEPAEFSKKSKRLRDETGEYIKEMDGSHKKFPVPWCVIACCVQGGDEDEMLQKAKTVLEDCIKKWMDVKPIADEIKVLSQKGPLLEEDAQADEDLAKANNDRKEELREISEKGRLYLKGYGQYKAENFPINKYVAAMSMLDSKSMYSKNLCDIDGIKATLKKVAKIDRLPDDNSHEGMQIVQMAWDKVDIFNSSSSDPLLPSFCPPGKMPFTQNHEILLDSCVVPPLFRP